MTHRFALIVEDDSKLGGIYSLVLQQAGYHTELIQDGHQALARLATASPDLILLDIHLPYVSGLELMQRIRALPRLASVPIIIQTADIYAAKALVDPLTYVLIKTMGVSPLRNLIAQLQTEDEPQPPAIVEQVRGLTPHLPLALIIEDDPKLGDIFALALRAANYQTEIINDGGLAQTRLHEVVPDLVVLDLQLPGVSGESLLRQIRSDLRLAQTSVVLATAVDFLANELGQDADLVLLKPISPIQLRDLALRLRAHPE